MLAFHHILPLLFALVFFPVASVALIAVGAISWVACVTVVCTTPIWLPCLVVLSWLNDRFAGFV